METFLELPHEVLKGVVREIGAYFFLKNVLEHKKTTHRRHKVKGGCRKKQTFTTATLTVAVTERSVISTLYLKYLKGCGGRFSRSPIMREENRKSNPGFI
ncbi:hypothetical protein ACF5W4_17190 [Bacillota bacterium Lsc_1132]